MPRIEPLARLGSPRANWVNPKLKAAKRDPFERQILYNDRRSNCCSVWHPQIS